MVAMRRPQPRSNRTVVLALPRSPLAASATLQLRMRGWTVWLANNVEQARRLASNHFPAAVVLPAGGDGESGWLTCAKLKLAQPRLRVILVGDFDGGSPEFAEYVRAAALIPEEVTAGDLIAEIEGVAVPA